MAKKKQSRRKKQAPKPLSKAAKVSPKAENKQPPIEQYLVHLYLVVVLSLQFTPLLNALDSNITKWLLLTMVNGGFWLLMLINAKKPDWQLNTALLNQWSVWLFSSLLVFSAISFVAVINYGEAWLGIIRYGVMLGLLLSYLVILDKVPGILDFVAKVVVLLILADGYAYLTEYMEKVYGTGKSNSIARSFYNNKNQIAITHLLKLPFVMYIFLTDKSFWRGLAAVGAFSAMLVFGLLLTRTAFLTLATISLILLIFYFASGKQLKPYKQYYHKGALLFGVVLLLGIGSAQGIQSLSYDALPESRNKRVSSASVGKGKTVAERLSVENFTKSPLRPFLWGRTLEMIRDYPVIGVGVNNWKVVFPKYDIGYYKTGKSAPRRAHSDPLQVMSELGVLGGLAFVAFFIVHIYYLFRVLKSDRMSDKHKIFAFLCGIGIVGYSIPSLLTFPLERANHQVFLLFFFAMLTFLYQQHAQRPKLPKVPTSAVMAGLLVVALASFHIQRERFISYRIQNNILPDITSGRYQLPMSEVEKVNRFFSSISADGTESLLSMKARYLIHEKKWQQAEQVMLEALKTNPFFYKNHVIMALIYYNMDNCEKSMEYARKVTRKRPLIDMYQLLYACTQKQEGNEKAGRILDELTTRNAEEGKGWMMYADWYLQRGQVDSAKALLDSALLNEPIRSNKESVWEKRVLLAFNQKDYKAADSLATEMIARFPTNVNAYANRGSARVNLNQLDKAIQDFDRTISLKPDHYLAIQNRGIANYMKQKYKYAIADLNKVIEGRKEKTPGQAFYFKGLAHQRLNQTGKACTAFRQAAQRNYQRAQAQNLVRLTCGR